MGIYKDSKKTVRVRALISELAREAGKGKRLPPVRQIAAQAGVAVNTALRALRCAQQEGIVTALPGRGIIASGLPDKTPAPAAVPTPAGQGPRHERIGDDLRRDIFEHRLRRGGLLPSVKELRSRFGAGHAAIRAALDILETEGIVVRRGRSYRVTQTASPEKGHRIILISRNQAMGSIRSFTLRSPVFLRTMEAECVRTGMEITPFEAGDFVRRCAAEGVRKVLGDDVVGVLVWTLGISGDEFEAIFAACGRARLRAAMLDEIGNCTTPPSIHRYPGVRLFRHAVNKTAGGAVGRALALMGHRRVICFDLYRHSVISGRADAIYETVTAAAHDAKRLVPDISPFDVHDDIWDHLSRSEPYASLTRLLGEIDGHAKRHGANTGLVDRFSFEGNLFVYNVFKHRMLDAMFEKALPYRATAWVGLTDEIAIAAVAFLRGRGIGVPAEISVVGFDDVIESIGTGLTTYNFNVEASALAMLDHILGRGGWPLRAGAGQDVEIPGSIIPRSTTGPAGDSIL